MSHPIKNFFILLVLLFLGFNPELSSGEESLKQEKKVPEEEAQEKPGNIFNMIFGAPPDMPTERGLLLINAFHDENGNQVKDPEEQEIRNEIVCRVDGIQYRIPAFIPALRLHENYRVECTTEASSKIFTPENESTELFIQRKGQVFFIELPCKKLVSTSQPTS